MKTLRSLKTLSLRRVVAGLICVACLVQAARLFLTPELTGRAQAATVAAANSPVRGDLAAGSATDPAAAPLPRYVAIPIEEVRAGDYVLTRDDTTGEFTSQPVVQTFRRTADHLRNVELRSRDGEIATIKTTNEHPFWVEGHGWTKAEELKPDDTVTDSNGDAVLVAATSYAPHSEGVPVFNFEVAHTHSYYVQAPNARGPPVWVHNACGPDGFIPSSVLEANPYYHGKAPTSVGAASQVNPRLVQRLEAFRAYKANGGAMEMRRWVQATQGNPAYGTGLKSGFADWSSRVGKPVHGNSLLATGPHDVYVLRNADSGQLLHFGETGRGFLTRFAEHQRDYAKLGIVVDVDFLRTVEGKAAARSLEVRYIESYMRIFGQRPPYNPVNH